MSPGMVVKGRKGLALPAERRATLAMQPRAESLGERDATGSDDAKRALDAVDAIRPGLLEPQLQVPGVDAEDELSEEALGQLADRISRGKPLSEYVIDERRNGR